MLAAKLTFAASPLLLVSLAALAVLGFSMVAYMTTANTLLQTTVPEELRGRVMGIWTLVSGGLCPSAACRQARWPASGERP